MTTRSDLTPSSALPIAYYAFAHAGLAAALGTLAVDPALPGGSFYQPRMVALVHLVTLAWLSGSILGSFYIVAPLALRLPMPVRRGDWVAFWSFVAGTIGMVSHFWINTYDGMAWSAGLVSGAFAWVAWRAWRGLPGSAAPWPVALHVALAFFNILSAAVLGILLGLDRTRSFLGVSPLALMFGHAHLAAVGWAAMMVVGLSYRLIPMILPAAMPTGRSLALSAVLIESGLTVLVAALLAGPAWVPLGAVLITGGLASFVVQIRLTLKRRLPRPPALPRRDWSTWQTHAALLWLVIATALGLALSIGVPAAWRLTVMWLYGIAGLVGFLAQIVVGMQGRLVPLYAWYRAMDARGGPPEIGANALPSAAFARPIFLMWTAAIPLLAWGLTFQTPWAIRGGAMLLAAAVTLSGSYIGRMLRRAQRSNDAPAPGS
ncbi:MAG: hypothetical protein WEB50_14810 [Vicinamibacterales bacterium]